VVELTFSLKPFLIANELQLPKWVV
jgi:hypothetical protein